MDYICTRSCRHGGFYQEGAVVPEAELLRAGPIPPWFNPVEEHAAASAAPTPLEALRRRADTSGVKWLPGWTEAQLEHAIAMHEANPPKMPTPEEPSQPQSGLMGAPDPTGYDMKSLRAQAKLMGIKPERTWKGADYVAAIEKVKAGGTSQGQPGEPKE